MVASSGIALEEIEGRKRRAFIELDQRRTLNRGVWTRAFEDCHAPFRPE
jgi:hypothetical protein